MSHRRRPTVEGSHTLTIHDLRAIADLEQILPAAQERLELREIGIVDDYLAAAQLYTFRWATGWWTPRPEQVPA